MLASWVSVDVWIHSAIEIVCQSRQIETQQSRKRRKVVGEQEAYELGLIGEMAVQFVATVLPFVLRV